MTNKQSFKQCVSMLLIFSALGALPMQAQVETPDRSTSPLKSSASPERNQVGVRLPLPGGASVVKDIAYVDHPVSQRQALDLYLPAAASDRSGKKVPLVVWIHGGAWRMGDKKGGPYAPLVREGFAAASINYRLTDEACYPAQYDDCVQAVRWLFQHADEYNIDSSRVGVWGASAGGHLSALLGLRAGYTKDARDIPIKAICDWFGPADLTWGLKEKAGKENGPIAQLLGGADKKELAVEASPIHYVRKNCPPILVMHGDQDNVVPLFQSEQLCKKLKEAGAPVQLEIIKGAGHGFGGLGPEAVRKVLEFFKTNLT